MAAIDKMDKHWPTALEELTEKFVANKPILLWIRDRRLRFTIGIIQREKNGYKFTLTSRRGVNAYIETTDGSDTVKLEFYSKGQP